MINIYDYIVNIMANSKAARMAMFSGASPAHGLKGNTGSGGGVKKGGAHPSGTGFMRSFAQRSTIVEPAKNKNFLFNFKQYLNPARHSEQNDFSRSLGCYSSTL